MENPYKGIESYEVGDKDKFWGRYDETAKITDLILNNVSTILTGNSGCGKTSLINAGLLPELYLCNYHLIRIRPKDIFEIGKEKKFPIAFWNKIHEKVAEASKEFTYYKGDDEVHPDSTTLFEELYLYDHIDKYGNDHHFVIVLDQFEELFQLNFNLKYVTLFLRLYNVMSGTLDYRSVKLVLDKIHEYCDDVENNIISYDDMDKISNETYTLSRFVISIRKDFLSDLQEYSDMFPVLDFNINYVNQLSDDQADTIIRAGFKEYIDNKDFPKKIIEAIIKRKDFDSTDGIPDYRVDTLTLSVVLFQLWENYVSDDAEKTIRNLKEIIVDKEFTDTFNNILDKFYGNRIISLIGIDGKEKKEKEDRNEKKEKENLLNLINEIDSQTVKQRLLKNLDEFIYKLQSKLVSDSGVYRQSVYIEDVCKMFDEYIYGNIDFHNVRDWLKDDISSVLKKILDELQINNWDEIKRELNEKQPKLDEKINDETAMECRKIFNKFIYRGKNETIREKLATTIRKCKLFVEQSKDGKTGMIEFRHDRLCKLAMTNLDMYEKTKQNVKRYSADIYFTPIGRLMHDNCFRECVFGPWDSYRSIMRTLFFMADGISETVTLDVDFAEKLKKINAPESHSLSFELGFRDMKDSAPIQPHCTSEGFTQFKVKIVDSKIYEISFWKVEDKKGVKGGKRNEIKSKVNLPAGYFKVLFYYDEHNRVILKNFYQTTNGANTEPAIINGYTTIHYKYKDEYVKYPSETYYLDLSKLLKKNEKPLNLLEEKVKSNEEGYIGDAIDKHLYVSKERVNVVKELQNQDKNFKIRYYKILDYCNDVYRARHDKDKNYGYKSEYDDYGREIERTILVDSNESVDLQPFNKIKFEKDNDKHNNLIRSISYYKDEEKVECDNVHKVTFKYDNKDRIFQTEYFDTEGKPCERGSNEIHGERYDYTNESTIKSAYLNKDCEENREYVMMYKISKKALQAELILWKTRKYQTKDFDKIYCCSRLNRTKWTEIKHQEIKYNAIYLDKDNTLYVDQDNIYSEKEVVNNKLTTILNIIKDKEKEMQK